MRKGFLGSFAALAAGAGAAWGQPPGSLVAPPAGVPIVAPGAGPVGPPPPVVPPSFGGFPPYAIPGNAGFAPPPTIMPPGNYGPPSDPLGLGPVGGFGPPPSPMYPMPGPYAEQSYQPAPPMPNVSGAGRDDLGYVMAPHWWFDGEYLLWFTRGQSIRQPLLTSSAPSDAGIPGAASTTVLVGNRDLGYNAMSGFRLSAGFFGDDDRRFGFQMSGFLMEHRSNIQSFGSLGDTSGIPTLARPFADVAGLTSTVVLSGPAFGPALVKVGTSTQTWSVEPEGVWNIYRSGPDSRAAWSLDFLAGYRFIQIKEDLYVRSATMLASQVALPQFTSGPFGVITQSSVTVNPAQANFGGVIISGPALVSVNDTFRTTNQFNGALFGLRSEARYGMFTTSTFLKVGVGDMHERLDVFGGSSFVDPTGRSGVPNGGTSFNNVALNSGAGGGVGGAYGGVLANASNIGTYVRDKFTIVPEVGTNVGIALTRAMSGYIGVDLLYFPQVIRPGQIVSPFVSSASIPFSTTYGTPGAARAPNVQLLQTTQWLGGVNFGVTFKY